MIKAVSVLPAVARASVCCTSANLLRASSFYGGLFSSGSKRWLSEREEKKRNIELQFHQVDAFTKRPFGGNPAAVAFYSKRFNEEGAYNLRWFTPKEEVDLCGHATLATAHVIFQSYAGDVLNFHTRSGVLKTKKREGMIEMELPAFRKESMPQFLQGVQDAVLHRPEGVFWNETQRHAVALFDSADVIKNLNPDLEKLKSLPFGGLICTALPDESAKKKCDFVYRYFAPKSGVNEDPATGSAQCSLLPYWAPRLGKSPNEEPCEDGSLQVIVRGSAVIVIKGSILIPAE